MLNQTSAFSHDEEISVLFKEIKERNQNKSAVIRSLLKFYRNNGYQMPVVRHEETHEEMNARHERDLEAEEGEG